MNIDTFCSTPCLSACCCAGTNTNLLYVQKEIDTPLIQVGIEGQVNETGAIECRLSKMHMKTAEEIAHLQCYSIKLEKQLAGQIPNYLNKIMNKSHVQYSGPVRAKQASIQYDECNGMTLVYDFFYVPAANAR